MWEFLYCLFLILITNGKKHRYMCILVYMSLPANEIYKIKVGDVYFTVKKSVSMAYSQSDPVYDYVRIGGEDMCVEYKCDRRFPDKVELQWLHTAGRKCVEGDMTIQGENTRLLFYISVQVLKLYTPVRYIDFLDNSHFQCKLPDKSSVKIFLDRYYFILHGKTWYHDKLGAYPEEEDDQKRYDIFKRNYEDPNMKPSSFDFNNEDLKKLFSPIWDKTHTWKEFIGAIKTLPNICQKMYPWYLAAIQTMRGKLAFPTDWRIDVRQLNFAPIPFERVEKITGGRPRMKQYIYDLSVGADYPIPSECMTLRYK